MLYASFHERASGGMSQSAEKVIWWIRRDLRLSDNRTLAAAASHGRTVVPVFVLDPKLLNLKAERRVNFMVAGLRALDDDLRKLGSQLFVKSGNPVDVIPELSRGLGGAHVYAEEDYTPYARKRDDAVSRRAPLSTVAGLTMLHPSDVLNREGEPFRVYSRFRARWEELARPRPRAMPARDVSLLGTDAIESEGLPVAESGPWTAGEAAARERLDKFVAPGGGLWNYASARSLVDAQTTSSLSPYIRFGMISASGLIERAWTLLERARSPAMRESARSWLNELIWREFFQSVLFHFPDSRSRSMRVDLEHINWRNDLDEFEAWRTGNTGYPIVDAAMRQLEAQGWIHNRLRMIVASFLVKDLLIDWRFGARWFMKKLIDGDTAANTGGWQWVAGTGLDAAPYFRVFNPVLQGRKFDPSGDYVKRWIPELHDVPAKQVHSPWEMDSPPTDYPAPIVDHALARKRALAAFGDSREHHNTASEDDEMSAFRPLSFKPTTMVRR